ncbi:hypothetical protein NC652_031509 [Populus alba x Populus x berolinensis]|nr:hypothetical protein NC652_031509 [Populus alba x Populus x berolinensis]
MVTIKQPLTVENPTCCSLWYGRPGVTSCYCQREACGVGLVEDTTLVRTKMTSCFNEGLLDVHDVEEMLGLVQLRSESKDHNDGDGGLPDCYCFPLCFCFFVSSLIFLYCSVALCYYWETKARTMVMVGDVCSAERGGQGWYGEHTMQKFMLIRTDEGNGKNMKERRLGMFGTKPVPAVGVSLGIERVFAIMEQLQKDRNEVR